MGQQLIKMICLRACAMDVTFKNGRAQTFASFSASSSYWDNPRFKRTNKAGASSYNWLCHFIIWHHHIGLFFLPGLEEVS